MREIEREEIWRGGVAEANEGVSQNGDGGRRDEWCIGNR